MPFFNLLFYVRCVVIENYSLQLHDTCIMLYVELKSLVDITIGKRGKETLLKPLHAVFLALFTQSHPSLNEKL